MNGLFRVSCWARYFRRNFNWNEKDASVFCQSELGDFNLKVLINKGGVDRTQMIRQIRVPSGNVRVAEFIQLSAKVPSGKWQSGGEEGYQRRRCVTSKKERKKERKKDRHVE